MHLKNFQLSINVMLNCGEQLSEKMKDFIFSMPDDLITKINDYVDGKIKTPGILLSHYENRIHWEIEYIKKIGLTVRKLNNNGNYDSILLTQDSDLKRGFLVLNDTNDKLYVGQYFESRYSHEKFYDVEIQYGFESCNYYETKIIQKNDGSEYSEKGKVFPMSVNFLSDTPHYLN